MLIVGESVCCCFTKICRYATNGQIHLAQFVCCIRVFLSVDGNLLLITVVGFYELHRLNKHTAGATAGVIENAIVRFNHFGDQINDTLRCVKFTLTLAFGKRKFTQEIFVNPSNNIIFLVAGIDFINFIQ